MKQFKAANFEYFGPGCFGVKFLGADGLWNELGFIAQGATRRFLTTCQHCIEVTSGKAKVVTVEGGKIHRVGFDKGFIYTINPNSRILLRASGGPVSYRCVYGAKKEVETEDGGK